MTFFWRAIALSASLGLAACSHEASDWKSAAAADTSESYQQFLQQYPNSPNAAQAHARVLQLQEDHDWQVASAADTRDAYEQFATQHPDSKWTQEARIRIENFAQGGGATNVTASTSAPSVARPAAAASAKHSALAKPTPPAAHYLQLGAFSTQAGAESAWKKISAKFPHELGALKPRYLPGTSHTHAVVRLQVGVPSRAAGQDVCSKLKKHAQSCVAVSA